MKKPKRLKWEIIDEILTEKSIEDGHIFIANNIGGLLITLREEDDIFIDLISKSHAKKVAQLIYEGLPE